MFFDIAIVAAILLIGGLFAAFDTFAWAVIFSFLVVGAGYFFFGLKELIVAIGWKVILIKWIPLYLAVGVVVAFLKWLLTVKKVANRIAGLREKFKPESVSGPSERSSAYITVAGNPDALRRYKFVKLWNESNNYDVRVVGIEDTVDKIDWTNPNIVAHLLTPHAKDYIAAITFWIFEWPFVVVSTFFKDFLVKLGKHVARFFDWAFTGLSRAIVGRATKGL